MSSFGMLWIGLGITLCAFGRRVSMDGILRHLLEGPGPVLPALVPPYNLASRSPENQDHPNHHAYLHRQLQHSQILLHPRPQCQTFPGGRTAAVPPLGHYPHPHPHPQSSGALR